jgi:protein-tyrosine phosphatase
MEKIFNFRDFGGYETQNGSRVKKGLLYRSGSLSNASEADWQKISALGIKTICDLRTHRERERQPDHIPDEACIKAIHLPIKVTHHNESGFMARLFSLTFGSARNLNYGQVAREIYQELVTDFRPEFLEIIQLAADPDNLPILIHCTAGKDRTGIACGLIQLILDVSPELVRQDYLLSNYYLYEFRMEILQKLRPFAFFGVRQEKFLPLLEVHPEYLAAALEQISRDYGTTDNYIRQGLGLTDEDRGRLKQLLLEETDKVNSNQ